MSQTKTIGLVSQTKTIGLVNQTKTTGLASQNTKKRVLVSQLPQSIVGRTLSLAVVVLMSSRSLFEILELFFLGQEQSQAWERMGVCVAGGGMEFLGETHILVPLLRLRNTNLRSTAKCLHMLLTLSRA